jgi:hypothetical protein
LTGHAATQTRIGELRSAVRALTQNSLGPDHIILAVVEADDIDSVRDFALQSRLMQWNTVKIHPTYSVEEALPLIDCVEPIF